MSRPSARSSEVGLVTHRYVTLAQAVEACDWLTERYARRLVQERKISFSKVGNRLLLDLADLEQLVEQNRVEATR